MKKRVLFKMLVLGTFAVMGASPFPAQAQGTYPSRPITLVVPFAAGGGTDVIARAIAKGIAAEIKGTIIIENKAGGGTILGSEQVARSAPDGHTLVISTIAHAANPTLNATMPYDTEKAFAPIALIATSFNVLVVKPESPIKSIADLIAAAQASPKKLTYASQGIGTSAHLAGELFQSFTKTELTHVPYRGAGPALNDLLGGHVDMMFATNASVAALLEAGSLRPMAITAPAGKSTLKNVPTFADSGLPNVVLNNWYAVLAPAGTPPAIIDRLNAAAKVASEDAEFQKVARTEGLTVRVSSPAELGAFISTDIALWRKVLTESKITRN
jgi:tripartite-type tricarboxylate transporter receptor subunit TctC